MRRVGHEESPSERTTTNPGATNLEGIGGVGRSTTGFDRASSTTPKPWGESSELGKSTGRIRSAETPSILRSPQPLSPRNHPHRPPWYSLGDQRPQFATHSPPVTCDRRAKGS